jgi:hypothetical protein
MDRLSHPWTEFTITNKKNKFRLTKRKKNKQQITKKKKKKNNQKNKK